MIDWRPLLFLPLLLALSLGARAQDEAPPASKAAKAPWAFVALLGYDIRWQQNSDSTISDHRYDNFALGIGFRDFYFIGEGGSNKTSSSVGSLQVNHLVESYLLSALWMSSAWKSLHPYLTGGLGITRDSVTSSIGVTTSTDIGKAAWQGQGGAGVKWANDNFWLSGEGRLYFGERQDPNPTLGVLVRVGAEFW